MKVLSADQMREVDRLTTERHGVPGLQLMENAAAATVEAVEKKFGPLAGKRAVIISGKGNNGGDGAAIARLASNRGASVELLLLGRVAETGGDARINFERAREIASKQGRDFRFVEIESTDQLRQQATSRQRDFFFDAIFGTGLTRPATGIFEEAISLINESSGRSTVIAVDIPSGIASDSAEPIGPAVHARMTVTFAAPKPGNILPPASDYSGELIVAPIGSPDELIRSAGSRLNLVERGMIESWLAGSRRSPHANKGDAGRVLIVAGSRGKTGAACLAGEAALRAGTGLVTVATPESSQPVVASRLIPECMTEALGETESGAVSKGAGGRLLQLASGRDVVAIGPGLGSSEESTRSLARHVVMNRTCPIVIDADGLNSLAPWPEDLRGDSSRPMILTPHPGEMARLIEKQIAYVIQDRVELTREFAIKHNVILVLKLSRTLIAAPDGQVYVNPTGNSGMATAGSGDVLTGVIAGLVAQKPDNALGATIAAVYLHGFAGDLAASRVGIRAMIASDITAHLGEAFIEVGGDAEKLRLDNRQSR